MVFQKNKALKRAEVHVCEGNFEAAIREYQQILAAEPGNLTIKNTLGDLHVRAGNLPEAIQIFLELSEYYEQEGFIAKATAIFKKVVKLDPHNIRVLLKLGDLMALRHQPIKARRQFETAFRLAQAAGQTELMVSAVERQVRLLPQDTGIRMNLAHLRSLNGDTPAAYDLLVQAGGEALRKKEFPLCLQAVQQALSLIPEALPGLQLLVDLYVRQGNVQAAVDMLQHRLARQPNNPELLVLLGQTLFNAGMLEEAEVVWEQVTELDPAQPGRLLGLAERWLETGRRERAVKIVSRLKHQSRSGQIGKQCIALLKDMLKRDPHYIAALRLLAEIYMQGQNSALAADTLNVLIDACLTQGRKKEAALALEQLVKLAPGRAPAAEGWLARIHPAERDGQLHGSGNSAQVPPSSSIPGHLHDRIRLLENLVLQQPDSISGRLQLKKLYLETGLMAQASVECMKLARLYEAQGDFQTAESALLEASFYGTLGQVPAPSASPNPIESARSVSHEAETGTVAKDQADRLSFPEFEKYLAWQLRRDSHAWMPISIVQVRFEPGTAIGASPAWAPPDHPVRCLVEAVEDKLKHPGDLLGFNGREDILLFLPECSAESAATFLETIRYQIASATPPFDGLRPEPPVTLRFGIATVTPFRPLSAPEVIETARRNLVSPTD
ncbi:MAG: tetratricopeptide repeat protein [Blastocatellia bacterium]|nr:tetratricopeptide repeat protein [Blastocatellia bacterium]